MFFVLLLAPVLGATLFESSIDRAFMAIRSNDWITAASVLDQASSEDPAIYAVNNFHYLRGRVAENLKDWARAREEFKKLGTGNPLYAQAIWRSARASAQLGDDAAAGEFISLLPKNFPADLKMQVARESSAPAALKIYADLSSRAARFQRAKLAGDTGAFWSLLREKKDDDVALDSARIVSPLASSSASRASMADRIEVAQTFAEHRQFEEALPLYRGIAEDPVYAPEARFQIARIHFLGENYQLALQEYQDIVKDFAGTDWEKDAEYQIASCYWRLGEYRKAEASYTDYIAKYGQSGEEGAIRNLIDVYRVLGENQKAIAALDRTLAKRLTVATRQVLLFTKAKVLFTQKRYAAALAIFQQLGKARLRSAAGGTTAEEVQYFQALCLSLMGNKAGAEAIWSRLARGESSYYGQRAAQKLGRSSLKSQAACTADSGATLRNVEADLLNLRRPLIAGSNPKADAVSELMFLRLWDEAFFWNEESGRRQPSRTAAQLAYMAGRYHRSISYASRLPRTASTLPLLYPAGYRELVCAAAGAYKVDPLWLHAIIWQESKYDPIARSGAAARGLMQFIPQTAASTAAAIGMPPLSPERLYEPAVSIQLGARYWSSLLNEWKRPEMALAAYNGGPDNVRRWKNKWPDAPDDSELFVADIGFIETKKYVLAVFAARAAYGALE